MAEIRTFDTGATRDIDTGKLDYEGFLSPLVLERYAQYMHSHRTQSDGSLRDSDNWQQGIPFSAYMKSLWRHFMDLWMGHRGYQDAASREDALCAIIFNASGYLHELRKNRLYPNFIPDEYRFAVESVRAPAQDNLPFDSTITITAQDSLPQAPKPNILDRLRAMIGAKSDSENV